MQLNIFFFHVFRDIVDVEILKKRIALVNICSASSGDKPDFFNNISYQIDRIGNQLIIAGGDWNVLLNIAINAGNCKGYANRPRALGKKKKKKKVPNMDKYDLVDVWPQVFPDKRGYMRRKFNTVQRDRLDCFLISEELMPDVNGVKLNRSHSSDHSLV